MPPASVDGLVEHLSRILTADRQDSAQRVGTLLMIGIEDFNGINIQHGRKIGNRLLRLIVERIRAAADDSDVVARLDGVEIAVLQSPAGDPIALAERIFRIAGRPYLFEERFLKVGLNIGMTRLVAGSMDADEALREASLALAAARTDSVGTWRWYTPEMLAAVNTRRRLVDELRLARERNQFELHFQPQVSADCLTLIGFEALLRWNRPGHGLVSPLEFVPVAEAYGLMPEVGEWVLREACSHAMQWPGHLRISVNVSAEQFTARGELVLAVRNVLLETGLEPSRLEIEVTESTLMRCKERALDQLRSLKALGVKVSMDDFGTGYSSLSRLLGFPFDGIKIDPLFVAALGREERATALVRMIAELGTSLSIATVAEGVETEAQASILRANGFTDIQGFLISHPLPAAGVGGFISEQQGRTR